jgi:hypothetical protein
MQSWRKNGKHIPAKHSVKAWIFIIERKYRLGRVERLEGVSDFNQDSREFWETMSVIE